MVKKYSITQFANLTGMNKETIRFYRNKGILNPGQDPDNAYFYYTFNDLVSLFFVRKQREMDIPLTSIQNELTSQEFDYQWIQERLDEAMKEKQKLEQQIEWLQFSLQYYAASQSNMAKVNVIDIPQDKYDFSIFNDENETLLKDSIDQQNDYALSVCIRKEDLLSDKEVLPMELKLSILERSLPNGIQIPSENTCFPKGKYLSIIIPVTQFQTIQRKQIEPLLTYAKEHHYEILSDTTSYLLNIKKDNTQTEYYLRLRVSVRKLQNIVDDSL